MFRRRNSEGLPTVSGHATHAPRFSFRNSPTAGGDGSASSIRLQSPVARAIEKSSKPVRITYGLFFTCILFMFSGYRYIRSQSASVWLTCHRQECHLQITPRGFRTTVSLHIARRQVLKSIPVKTKQDGTFVTSEGVKLHEDWKDKKGRNKKKKSANTSNYKGPDPEGNYLSYAVLLRDAGTEAPETPETVKTTLMGMKEEESPDADLTSVKHFLDATDEPGVYRLIIRKFNIAQTKRRIRTISQKIDSYIKKRRHKLLLKENAAPSWQGILICIVGLIGFCLTLLLGQFWDDPPKRSSGPGVRRRKAQPVHAPQHKRTVDPSVYQTQTPSRYEVPVGTRPISTGSSGGIRKRS